MNLKKVKMVAVVVIFLLCFPIHFLYDWLPNTFFSIFTPVNERIWEHMKIIYTSYFIYGGIEYIVFKDKIQWNNFLLQLFCVPLIGIMIYLAIYLPLYHIFGEYIFISIGLLFLIIIFEEVISYYILQSDPMKCQNIIGIMGIFLIYIIFTYLTYHPLHNYLFLDVKENRYGICIYK